MKAAIRGRAFERLVRPVQAAGVVTASFAMLATGIVAFAAAVAICATVSAFRIR